MQGLDLLDFFNTQFDRDYLEFNVNIHDLEMNLQTFINRSFENISSTEQALNLLKQIQQIMQRDSLKADLEAKYMIIFQHYGLDMDSVQKIYETHKVRAQDRLYVCTAYSLPCHLDLYSTHSRSKQIHTLTVFAVQSTGPKKRTSCGW